MVQGEYLWETRKDKNQNKTKAKIYTRAMTKAKTMIEMGDHEGAQRLVTNIQVS